MSEVIERIPLDQLRPSKGNRRTGGIDAAKIAGMADSIKAIGVQQPAVVRKIDTDEETGALYEIVAGERRWRASRLAGLDYLPCVIRELTDAQALRIQVVENLQREDVHPLDEADGYARLRAEGGYSVELIAQEVGRSPAYVYQRLRLERLVPSARQMLLDGDIQVAHAVLLARLEDDQQFQALKVNQYQIHRGYFRASDLDAWIRENVLMELKAVAWKLADEKLVPKAGACTACPKRTSAEPALFEDISADHCLDSGCYKAKQAAIMKKNRAELGDGLLVREGWYYSGKEKGVLNKSQWEECKKKDEGALKCLVLDGKTPGRLTWGRKTASAKPDAEEEGDDDGEPSPFQKHKEARDKRTEANKAVNRRLYDRVLRLIQGETDLAGILRIVISNTLGEGYNDDFAMRHGWVTEEDTSPDYKIIDALEKLETPELVGILVELEIEQAGESYGYQPVEECLSPWLKLLEIDAEAVRKSVYEEMGAVLETEEPDQDDEEPGAEEDEEGTEDGIGDPEEDEE